MSLTPLSAIAAPIWLPLGHDLVTAEPLRADDGGYAHLGYRDALAAVAALEAELPTAADLDALRDASIVLQPVILPDVEMVRGSGCHAPPGSDEWNASAQRLREACMCGPTWAAVHDARVQAQLDALSWDGSRPVSNIGKPWIAGAPKGRAFLKGWFIGGHWIQQGAAPGSQGPHDDLHCDYSSVVVAIRRGAA